MTTAGTLTAEIAAVKSQMVGLDTDSDAFSSLQVILNEMRANLVVATAGQGANLGSLSTQVAAVKNDSVLRLNNPVRNSTRHGKGDAIVTAMGWT